MPPDFSKKTIEILGKRAGYRCSNPTCRVFTVGPNSTSTKATVLGEAAHIHGARPSTARFDEAMTDKARAEITNGIWLCRNCHKIVDADSNLYSSKILHGWREKHEQFTSSSLAQKHESYGYSLDDELLLDFSGYPAVIRRIILDKPLGWQLRLSAELMRSLNGPVLRKLHDLRSQMYTLEEDHIGEDEVLLWYNARITEMTNFISPIGNLIKRLNDSWGIEDDITAIDEIHHTTKLIRDALTRMLAHEECLVFSRVPSSFRAVRELLINAMGRQVDKISEIPGFLDEAHSLIGADHGGTIENPYEYNKVIEFDLPKGWSEKLNKEFSKANRKLQKKVSGDSSGCGSAVLIGAVLFILLLIIL